MSKFSQFKISTFSISYEYSTNNDDPKFQFIPTISKLLLNCWHIKLLNKNKIKFHLCSSKHTKILSQSKETNSHIDIINFIYNVLIFSDFSVSHKNNIRLTNKMEMETHVNVSYDKIRFLRASSKNLINTQVVEFIQNLYQDQRHFST